MKIMIKDKSIFESKLLCVLFLLILVQPEYMTQFSVVNKLYIYGSFFVTIILILFLIIEKHFDFSILWIILFYGVSLIATLLGSGEIYEYCKIGFRQFAMCLLFALYLRKSPGTLLESFKVLYIYIYIDLITIMLFPDGMYETNYTQNWFLGYKNYHIRTILPIIAMALMYSYWKFSKISIQTYILILCSIVIFLMIDSSTGLLSMALFLLLFFLFHSKVKRIPKSINLLTTFVVILIAEIGIIFFSVQTYFANFITNVLNKSVTFTGRVAIWEKAWEMIKNSSILGYGYLSSDSYAKIFGSVVATHPHNYILYILCTGGIVLFAILVIGILYANKKLNENMNSVYSKIAFCLLTSFFFMGISEAITMTVLLYPSYILAMNIDNLTKLGYNKEPLKLFGKKIVWRKND